MQSILEEAGITVTQENKKEIDRKIHEIVDVSYKNCSETWKAIKEGTAEPAQRAEFISKLKEVFKK
jgi:ATP-dependent Zn protease